MALTFRTQVNLKLTDPIVGVAINQQKISTDAENTSTITGTATGGSSTALIDTTVDFASLGVDIGSIVTRVLGGTSIVTSISTTTNLNDTLNFLALSGGASFVATNLYTVSTELDLNFTAVTYEIPANTSLWAKISRGDIGKIRNIFLILISDYQFENIDILITSIANPNLPSVLPKTFSMRDLFVATTDFETSQDIWIKNPGSSAATVLAIIGGENI